MYFEGKGLKNIQIDDIQFLVDNQIVEDVSLEFKAKCWGKSDSEVRELLRDISSMANARGGHIIIGIEEDEERDGVPKSLIGIENAEEEKQRILNLCLACIDERLIGLDAKIISVSNGIDVIVLRVPRSTRVPHIITYKHLYQCWRRHGKSKSVMTIDEIREACNRVENVRQSLEEYLVERKTKKLQLVSNEVMLYLSATPIMVKQEIVDVFDTELNQLLKSPPSIRGKGSWNVNCCDSYGGGTLPTLYGIKANRPGWKSIEIFRNGHVEFTAFELLERNQYKVEDSEISIINSLALVEYIVNFIRFLVTYTEITAIYEPIIVSLMLRNVRGTGLFKEYIPRHDYGIDIPSIYEEENDIVLPSIQVHFYEDNPNKMAKVLADRIWNAFNFKNAHYFDEEGNFSPTP